MRMFSESVGSAYALSILWFGMRVHMSLGSIYKCSDVTADLQFTEFMFTDFKSMFFLLTANSMTPMISLRTNISLDKYSSITKGPDQQALIRAVAMIYSNSIPIRDMTALTSCHSSDIGLRSIPRSGEKQRDFSLQETIINKTSSISIDLMPDNNELYTVRIFSCWDQNNTSINSTNIPLIHLASKISFRNSYGYLPALLVERLPVSGILAILYGLVDLYYILLLARYHNAAFRLQYLLLIALLLASCESMTWFFTYSTLNTSGDPICCPFPARVLLATIIGVANGCFARVLTTLICLGYGILRQSITRPELTVLCGLGVCYFASACCLQLSHIVHLSDGITYPSIEWRVLATATDACFMCWIFTSLSLSRHNLKRFDQRAKLEMYSCLHRILVAYSSLSIMLVITESFVYAEVIPMNRTIIWRIWAIQRLLVFCTFCAVTLLWRPQVTSALYARMEQIPGKESQTPTHQIHEPMGDSEEDDQQSNSLL
uniref:Uncharacterized protein AlNc14C186G8321 n=1 Tax=Albugo laibachii Nc14 TaxID=890382 RepID=F0WPH6_9STRA|nr:conserved hypothetical protein [Albugo laibachii Nc14]|eukprot:CCA23224.1 conserved hypothetical protein [Albugo laibachii Nc14]